MRTPASAGLALLLAACAGSAGAATHSWQVTDFARLRVEGPFEVRVFTGRPSGVRATGPQEMIDRLEVEQHGDLVVLHPVRSSGWGSWHWSKGAPLVIEIGTRTLAAATLAGSGSIAIDRLRGEAIDLALAGSGDLSVAAADVGEAKLAVTGSGDLTIAGHARTAHATVTGSGDLHGDALIAEEASISLVGSGDLSLGARRNAAVNLAGSGDVHILGPALCTVTRGGSGNVVCAHQTETRGGQ